MKKTRRNNGAVTETMTMVNILDMIPFIIFGILNHYNLLEGISIGRVIFILAVSVWTINFIIGCLGDERNKNKRNKK